MSKIYDSNWVARKVREVAAAQEAEKFFPLPSRVDPTNPHHIVEVDKTFHDRKQYVEKALRQH